MNSQGLENVLSAVYSIQPKEIRMTTHHLSCVRIYDVDDSGSINITEMTSIISTMDELEGEENMQGKDSPAARYKGVRGKMFT
jgi:Ca2+-binding EF-hand superfamily protein